MPDRLIKSGDIYRGSELQTGVDPQGVDAGNDDLYFVGFNTKINPEGSGDALLSRIAKFPDGEYSMVLRAHSVRYNNVDYIAGTASEAVTIDNFRPYVERVAIADADDPEDVRYDHSWRLAGALLTPVAAQPDLPLLPGGNYKVRIAMSEYTEWPRVRQRDGPELPVVDGTDYTDTRTSEYTATLQVPSYNEDQLVPLLINDTDYAGNQLLALEQQRPSIDPAGELTRGADGVMQGAPGEDGYHYLRVDAAPPVIGYNKTPLHYNGFSYSCQGDVPERCGTEAEPVNIVFSSVPFLYADIGSGIKELHVYKERLGGEEVGLPVKYNDGLYAAEPVNASLALKDGKYAQVAIDNLGRGTTMYFRIDPVTPRLEISSITIAPPYTTYSVYGVVVDTGSGLDRLELAGAGVLPLIDKGTESVKFSFTGLNVDSPDYYKFFAQDKAGNISYPQPVMQLVHTGFLTLGNPNAVVNHISEVWASGRPCHVSIKGRRRDFEIPIFPALLDETSIETDLTVATTYPVLLAVPGKDMYGELDIGVSQDCVTIDSVTYCTPLCQVEPKGDTVMSYSLGPKVAVGRTGPEAGDLAFALNTDWWKVEIENLRWESGVPPAFTAAVVGAPPAPQGYVNYPPWAPAGLRLELAGALYDRINLYNYTLMQSLGDPDKARIRMLKYKDGAVTDVTSGFADNVLMGTTLDNCTFTLVAPLDIFDKTGPVVTLIMVGKNWTGF